MNKTLKKLKHIYLLYSIVLMYSIVVVELVFMISSYPSGSIVSDYNLFGEYGIELILFLSAIPGYILLFFQHLSKNISEVLKR